MNLTKELNKLKKEMIGEAENGMKQIAKDWRFIHLDYCGYRYGLKLTCQEAFYCALIDNGYLELKDLEYD